MARKYINSGTPDPAKDPFNEKLVRLVDRGRKGRTDAEIARAAGIDPRVLSRILNGQSKDIKLSTLRAILGSIGATLSEYDRA